MIKEAPKTFIMLLSAFWSIAATAYIGCVTFMDIPESNTRFADTILGFLLGTVVSTVLNFWLGSSVGSKEKDKNASSAETSGPDSAV